MKSRARPATPPAVAMTADELLRLGLSDEHTELVNGQLVGREPAGYRHGEIAAHLLASLYNFVESRALGRVLSAETGFVLRRNPDTVRAPDIAFVRRERVPLPSPSGFADIAPDLVIEVLSPNDRPADVLGKIGDWLDAGVLLVWIIDPQDGDARVYRADGSQEHLGEHDWLDGESVVPGFRWPLENLRS